MIASIIGFFVSLLQVYSISQKWGVAFMLAFLLMFIASIVSMTTASTSDEDLHALGGRR
jgi:type III secretory pathway component EscS